MTLIARICLLALVLLSGCSSYDPETSANLADLALSAGQLDPDFSSKTTIYSALVGEDVDSITVTVTATDSDAIVFINSVEVSSNKGSLDVPLALGSNTINVNVLYILGTISTTKVYVVVVTRQAGAWSVGGTASGLNVNGVLGLQNNGADDLALTAGGPFTFVTPVADGEPYDVTVSGQPVGQACTVMNGQGTINGAAVTDIAVVCVNTP
jgi:hypothetical protein